MNGSKGICKHRRKIEIINLYVERAAPEYCLCSGNAYRIFCQTLSLNIDPSWVISFTGKAVKVLKITDLTDLT